MTIRRLLTLSLLMTTLTGCTSGIAFDSEQGPFPGIVAQAKEEASADGNDLANPEGKVTVWSYYSGAEWIIPIIEKQYPKLKVEVLTVSWDDYIKYYLTAMDNGKAPDVLFVDNNMLNQLVGLKIAEDLTVAPYEGETLAKLFPEPTIAPYRSLSDNHLFALPLDIGPGVAYYRRDLFEKAGLPSEPVALSQYLELPEHWLEAAEKLKEQGTFIASTEWDPIYMAGYGSGFFDRELNYIHDTPAFATALDLARQIRVRGLASGLNLDSAAGQTALKDGRTAMFYNGWWYLGNLKNAAPDTAGLWGIMRLPLRTYGWSGSSGTLISSSSRNKAGAWAVVSTLAKQIQQTYANGERMLTGEWTDYGDAFYAGQRTQVLYAELVRHMPSLTPTPMDVKAYDIWNQMVGSALSNNTDANIIFQNIKRLTMDSIQSEVETLKSQLR